jgi:hypothetical protein
MSPNAIPGVQVVLNKNSSSSAHDWTTVPVLYLGIECIVVVLYYRYSYSLRDYNCMKYTLLPHVILFQSIYSSTVHCLLVLEYNIADCGLPPLTVCRRELFYHTFCTPGYEHVRFCSRVRRVITGSHSKSLEILEVQDMRTIPKTIDLESQSHSDHSVRTPSIVKTTSCKVCNIYFTTDTPEH